MRIGHLGDDTGGHRILVDRLWPRGVRKEDASWDAWRKDLAPSTALRKAYHAGELTFEAFAEAYREELAELPRPDLPKDAVLVTARRDLEHSHAAVLRDWLEGDMPKTAGRRRT